MNTKKWGCLILWFIALTLITLGLVLHTSKVAASPSAPVIIAPSPTPPTSTVAVLVVPEKPKPPIIPQILLNIAYCESGGRQFYADGKVVTGHIDHADTGRFQINKWFHEKTAKAMGLDLDTDEGNTAYALFLYKTQGTTPWNASKSCWGNIEAWKKIKKTYY